MTTHPVFHNPEFDTYAADYDAALAQGLAVSGLPRPVLRKRLGYVEVR